MLIGVDEVGRGCLAGPVCVAAVAYAGGNDDINDSKQLSMHRRQLLAMLIKQQAEAIGIGWASSQEIDRHGMTQALCLAGHRALLQLPNEIELIMLDGSHNYLHDDRVVTIIKGDTSIPAIAAASIVAKVSRDNLMQAIAQRFSGYGFERHMGYATAAHRQALAALGPSPVHRLSFAPLKGSDVN